MHPLQQFFGQVPLFSRLEGDELNEILRCVRPLSLRKGQQLFSEGEPGDAAYVVQSGTIEVFTRRGRHEVRLASLGVNEVVGELSLIDGEPRSASARAAENTELFRVDRAEFDFLRRNLRPACYKVMHGIALTLLVRIQSSHKQVDVLAAKAQPKASSPPPTSQGWMARVLTPGRGGRR